MAAFRIGNTSTALSLGALALTGLSLGTALAAPLPGPGDLSFYSPPTPLPAGPHGELIRYRDAAVKLGDATLAIKAWTVLYSSVDSLGAPNVVTGTVLVPQAAWTGPGPRPVIALAMGTQGLAQACAPSLQFVAGTEYESPNVVAALKAGYAVAVSDYAGYTHGSTPTYLAGASAGHAVLDSVQAAMQIPGAGISADSPVAIWGYSQGGQAAAWAGELMDSYAPSLKVKAVAAGGIPADFKASAGNLDGNVGAGFLVAGLVGLATQYPEQIPLGPLLNAEGQATVAQARAQCIFQDLFGFMNKRLSQLTVGNQSWAQLQADPGISQVLEAQNVGRRRIPVPLYQYHGQADQILPLDQALALKKRYCSLSGDVSFALYPSEHITTEFQAAAPVLSWLGERFAGKPTASTCQQAAPDPVSTAQPGGGDLVVAIQRWPLSGALVLKTLGQTITLPPTSTFSGITNLNRQSLTGELSIPTVSTTIKLLGTPMTILARVSQVGQAQAQSIADTAGLLHVRGTSSANVSILSFKLGSTEIPVGCTTNQPVVFPINFDGPIAALGNGTLTFSGTTRIPTLGGCGAWGPLLSVLMSGTGQAFRFTVVPPSPIAW
jgi:Secretory lipase